MRKHPNKHFQRAWNKYGESNFDFVILEEVDNCNIQAREQHHINDTPNRLIYNIANEACRPPSQKGKPKSKMHKKKISQAHKGKVLSPEHKRAFIQAGQSSESRAKAAITRWGTGIRKREIVRKQHTYRYALFTFQHKDGRTENLIKFNDFVKKYKIEKSNLWRVVSGQRKSTKGWMLAEMIVIDENFDN